MTYLLDPPEYTPDDETPETDYEMTNHFIAHCHECGALPPGVGGSAGCKPSCRGNTPEPHIAADLLLAVLDALRQGIDTTSDAYRIGAICSIYANDLGLNARSTFDVAAFELNRRGMLTPDESEHAQQLIAALWADPK